MTMMRSIREYTGNSLLRVASTGIPGYTLFQYDPIPGSRDMECQNPVSCSTMTAYKTCLA